MTEAYLGAFSIFLAWFIVIGGAFVCFAVGFAMNQLDRKPLVKPWQNRAEKRRYQKANDSITVKIEK